MLNRPQYLELIGEVSEWPQERGEMATCSDRVIRRMVEGWTDKESVEMRVDMMAPEKKESLCTSLIPLAELDTGIRGCRSHSERRISAAWGDVWEINLKKTLPKYTSETFLRELAVFTKEHIPEWSKDFFEHHIQGTVNRPWSRKDLWQTSRDLVMEGELATWQKRRITEVEEDVDTASLLAGEGEATMPRVAERNVRADLTPLKNSTLPLSSPPPRLAAPAPLSSSTRSSCRPTGQNPNQYHRAKRERPNRKGRDRDKVSAERK